MDAPFWGKFRKQTPVIRFCSAPCRRLTTFQEANMNALHAMLERGRPFVLSLLRIVAALLFLEHGLSKLFGFPVAGPPLEGLLIVAAILETVGAAFLLVGAWTRLVALLLSGEMAFAYFMAHEPKSFYPLVNGGDSVVLFCFVFLYLVFAGGGPLSVDRLFLKQR
jgi:putative oxidoreductase